jgi:hypothetical protein
MRESIVSVVILPRNNATPGRGRAPKQTVDAAGVGIADEDTEMTALRPDAWRQVNDEDRWTLYGNRVRGRAKMSANVQRS